VQSSGGTQDLRPFNVGELLDAAFKVYRSRFKALVLCVLVPTVPFSILQVLLLGSVNEAAFDPFATPEEVQSTFSGVALVGFLITLVLSSVITLLGLAACTKIVAAAYLDEPMTWQTSLKFAVSKLLPVIWVGFLWYVLSTLGLLALIVGGVFVFIRLAVVVPTRLVEDVSGFKALGRSWFLVKDRFWVTFLLFVVVIGLLVALSTILQLLLILPAAALGSTIAVLVLSALSGILGNIITLPLFAAVITLHYFDLRVRKEGLDLQLLAQRIGTQAPAAAPVAAPSGLGSPAGGPSLSKNYGGFSAPRAPEERDTT